MRLSPAYLEYLASPEWQAKRAHIFTVRLRRCERCGAFGCRLDVHHKTYARFGCELDSDLEILCRGCHDAEHASRLSGPRSSRASAMSMLTQAEVARWRRP